MQVARKRSLLITAETFVLFYDNSLITGTK